MSVAVKVSCPVCHASLSYSHDETEAWGTIGLTDFGIVELTAHDKGQVIGPHMREHHADGSWETLVRQRAENMAGLVKRLDEARDQRAREAAPKLPFQEALAFAEQGSRIAIFADGLELAQSYVADFEKILDENEVTRAVKVNGAKAIHFRSEGFIRFYSTRSIPRGLSFDRLYVPASVQHAVMERLAPLVMTSKEPAIVGYF